MGTVFPGVGQDKGGGGPRYQWESRVRVYLPLEVRGSPILGQGIELLGTGRGETAPIPLEPVVFCGETTRSPPPPSSLKDEHELTNRPVEALNIGTLDSRR